MYMTYYKEVLGKMVWCRHTDKKFYRGRVTKLREEISWNRSGSNSSSSMSHYVEYDDGDVGWVDLKEEDQKDNVRWSDPSSYPSSKKTAARKRKKKAVEDEDTDEDQQGATKKVAAMNIRPSDEEKGISDRAKHDKVQDLSTDDSGKESSSGNESDGNKEIRDNIAKEWIRQLNLQNQYGAEEKGLALIDEESFVPPRSFEFVFLLADFLFPGHEYHHRLFKSDPRPGNKVRVELRKIKKRNKDDPLVSWHEHKKEWAPPNKAVLIGMVEIIRRFQRA